jgi:hypothetical protein
MQAERDGELGDRQPRLPDVQCSQQALDCDAVVELGLDRRAPPGYSAGMLIKSYGLFWNAKEIKWNPGPGKGDIFRLLGRRGNHLPGLRITDFRYMQGIYILYGHHGPHYVGLTRKQGLGKASQRSPER